MNPKGKNGKSSLAIKILMPVTAILLAASVILNYVANYFDYILDQYIGAAKVTVTKAEGTEGWNTDYYGKSNTTAEDAAQHSRDVALKVAEEGFVLLKNEDDLLPLQPGTKVAVIGDFAETPRYQGAGSSVVNCTQLDTFLERVKESGLDVIGYAQGFERHGKPDKELKINAGILAKKADAVILCLGLDEIQESEGLDRTTMDLAANQQELLHFLQAANPNIAVVFHAGSSVTMPWLSDCKALLYAALCGQAGAGAVCDALVGKVNPSGKLAETWALHYADVPSAANFAGPDKTVEYREGPFIGYRYFETTEKPVQFPFGYGLFYTSFVYSDLTADTSGVTLTVANTGKCAGSEIVQLYVGKPDSKIIRPAKELKGFAKVQLAPGEKKTVTIPFDDKAFRYWNVKTETWETEPGRYEIMVGASVQDIRLRASIVVAGTQAPLPEQDAALGCYRRADVKNVSDDAFSALLGHPIPPKKAKIDRNLTFGEMLHGRSPLGWLVWAVLTLLLKMSLSRGKPDLNILFIYNMPLRALAKMTNGMVSMGMVDGLVMELQGFWIIGLVRVLVEFVKNLILNAQMEKRLRGA